MKVALVHDALINRGGAERVFQVLCEMFDGAPVYTSVYLPEATLPFFKSRDIRTTPLQRVVRSEGQLKALFPLALYYMSKMRLDDCDLIISSSTFCGKFVKSRTARQVCLCYRPFRLLWSPDEYKHRAMVPAVKLALRWGMPLLRRADFLAAQRVHTFLTTTPEMRRLIREVYGREALVVRPPLSVRGSVPSRHTGTYYLVVSRLEAYKRVDLAIEAFNELGAPLVIVGAGPLEAELKRIAGANIRFLGTVGDGALLKLYTECRAVICPQEEDFGLVPLEANACGKPALCYGVGGVTETMVPHDGSNCDEATAIFFHEQSKSALINAVANLERVKFSTETLQRNALRFHPQHFREDVMAAINVVLNVSRTVEARQLDAIGAR